MIKQHSPAFLKQRKFLLVLPLLVLSFITMAFWALGGGQGRAGATALIKENAGLNPELPGAHLDEKSSLDKMAYYEKAESDSAKIRDFIKTDPYYGVAPAPSPDSLPAISNRPYRDPNEEKVHNKLDQLNAVLNQPAATPAVERPLWLERKPAEESMQPPIQTIHSSDNEGDPELNKLNGMLEKILDIQHPERLKEKLLPPASQQQGQAHAVTTAPTIDNISLMDTSKQPTSMAPFFFSAGDNSLEPTATAQNSIEAVVHETQTLVNGATVKMRLLNDVWIDGRLIGKDNFVYGTAALNNERLEITIKSIRDGHSVYLVKLQVYDMDGMAGIYIPGAITRDVAKQSTDNAIQSIALNSLDPSIGAQAAGAGIETAKTLLSKKVKLVKVQVKAGYKILLKDFNN